MVKQLAGEKGITTKYKGIKLRKKKYNIMGAI